MMTEFLFSDKLSLQEYKMLDLLADAKIFWWTCELHLHRSSCGGQYCAVLFTSRLLVLINRWCFASFEHSFFLNYLNLYTCAAVVLLVKVTYFFMVVLVWFYLLLVPSLGINTALITRPLLLLKPKWTLKYDQGLLNLL